MLSFWEWGTGETLACGTGCCATVVACILNGLTDSIVNVHVIGGEIVVQWIAINYVVIFQALFLSWKLKGDISYEDVEKIVAVIIRMTGYSDEDIEEYLEASFQEIIWEWGYMALLMGEDK